MPSQSLVQDDIDNRAPSGELYVRDAWWHPRQEIQKWRRWPEATHGDGDRRPSKSTSALDGWAAAGCRKAGQLKCLNSSALRETSTRARLIANQPQDFSVATLIRIALGSKKLECDFCF